MNQLNKKPYPRLFLQKTSDRQLQLFQETYSSKDNNWNLIANDIKFPDRVGEGQHIVIVGAGIGGLTAAYEFLSQNTGYTVTVLEARERIGGRCLTLRPQDTITEVIGTEKNKKKYTQTCTFEIEPNKPVPYLNAGPGRIPSSHRNVLNYCQLLDVELEPYIMESRSNIHHSETEAEREPKVNVNINRRIINDIRGHLAAMLYYRIRYMKKLSVKDKESFRALLKSFGSLSNKGKYELPPSKEGPPRRSGYDRLPTVQPGTYPEILDFEELLDAKYWENGALYQPEDWYWQQTSFQPVGGMDMIARAFEREIIEKGGAIKVNAPVTSIKREGDKWAIKYRDNGKAETLTADICISNVPIPLLKGMVHLEDFAEDYQEALQNVFNPAAKFLDPSTKVGWQAERALWQNPKDENQIPIYGGISRTSQAMTQLWYPSDRFFDKFGILTGAYNYRTNAILWGKMTPKERLATARKELKALLQTEHPNEIKHGITVAWQNIPYIKKAWANWGKIREEDKEKYGDEAWTYNMLLKGDNGFFTCGDQNSQQVGWQEGAIQSALNVFGQVAKVRGYYTNVPQSMTVPDTVALTEGSIF